MQSDWKTCFIEGERGLLLLWSKMTSYIKAFPAEKGKKKSQREFHAGPGWFMLVRVLV